MENPLRTARLNRGLTIDSLARQASVSKQLIIRSEQGTYVNPPPNLVTFLFPLSADQLTCDQAYRDFQNTQRRLSSGTLIPDPPVPPVGEHPFIHWRTSSGITSTMRFCILFCVQHAILHKFETKPRSVTTTPTNLKEALLDAEIHEDAVNLLEVLFQNYKRQLRSTNAA